MTEKYINRYTVRMVFEYEIDTDDIEQVLSNYYLPDLNECDCNEHLMDLKVDIIKIEKVKAPTFREAENQ